MMTVDKSAELGQVFVERITLDDAAMPLLQIAARDNSVVGATTTSATVSATVTPNKFRTIQIANGSSSASKLLVAVNYGPTSANYTQYQFSAGAAMSELGGSSATSIVHTQVTTLGALVKALRALLGGDAVQAYRLDASADYSLDTNDFVDMAQTLLPSPAMPLSCLYRDASEVFVASARVGFPAKMDSSKLRIVRIEAVATFGSGTTTVSVATDMNDVANEEKMILADSSLVTATRKTLYDFSVRPLVAQGPLLVKLANTAVAPTSVEVLFVYGNASA